MKGTLSRHQTTAPYNRFRRILKNQKKLRKIAKKVRKISRKSGRHLSTLRLVDDRFRPRGLVASTTSRNQSPTVTLNGRLVKKQVSYSKMHRPPFLVDRKKIHACWEKDTLNENHKYFELSFKRHADPSGNCFPPGQPQPS